MKKWMNMVLLMRSQEEWVCKWEDMSPYNDHTPTLQGRNQSFINRHFYNTMVISIFIFH